MRNKDQREVGLHFLFVLIWPTWPQLAHLRSVPAVFAPATGEDGEPASSAGPSKWTPFCLSRAMRRSLFRCRRANSFSSLRYSEHLGLFMSVMAKQYLNWLRRFCSGSSVGFNSLNLCYSVACRLDFCRTYPVVSSSCACLRRRYCRMTLGSRMISTLGLMIPSSSGRLRVILRILPDWLPALC